MKYVHADVVHEHQLVAGEKSHGLAHAEFPNLLVHTDSSFAQEDLCSLKR